MPGVLIQLSYLYTQMKNNPQSVITALCIARMIAIVLTLVRFWLFVQQLNIMDAIARSHGCTVARLIGLVIAEAIITLCSVGVVLWAMTKATTRLRELQ